MLRIKEKNKAMLDNIEEYVLSMDSMHYNPGDGLSPLLNYLYSSLKSINEDIDEMSKED